MAKGTATTNHFERLRNGETIQFRPHGNSMMPYIKSGALVTIVPVSAEGLELQPKTAVYCTVRGRKFLHFISAVRDGQYQISNATGHVNGWITAKQIYGVLAKVEP